MDVLRLSARRLSKRRVSTIAAIGTLACAIAATSATWSLLSSVLLRPIAVNDPSGLVVLGDRGPQGSTNASFDAFIYPWYPLIRDSGIFESVVADWNQSQSWPVAVDAAPSPTMIGFATHDFFPTLGVPIPLGRGFTATDDQRGAPLAVLLTDRYWHETLGGDSGVIGRRLTVSGKPATVIGVLAPGFRGHDLSQSPAIYLPLRTLADIGSPFINYFGDPSHPSSPTAGLAILARIRPGESTAIALQRLAAVALPAIARTHPSFALTPIEIAAVPAAERGAMRQFGGLLAATVGLLLLIGCSSVGMLLLIRTEARRQEFATCLALGASRAQLALGVAVEGALLSGTAAVAALPLAPWLLTGIRAFRLPGRVDVSLLPLSIDAGAIAAAMASALLATLLIALIAAVFGFPRNVSDALRSHGGNAPTSARRRLRSFLIVGQVAIALVLVTGAGLFTRSLISALELNASLGADRLLTTSVRLDPFGRPTSRDTVFYDEVVRRLATTPTIAAAAVVASQGGMRGTMVVDGLPRQFASQISFDAVDNQYFGTMRLPILEGRDFTTGDRAGGPPVAIVSHSFAHALSPDGHPLGRRITMPFHRSGQPPAVVEIVGVVPDVITSVSTIEPLSMYFPIVQVSPGSGRTVVVRAASSPDAARRDVVAVLKQIDASITPGPVATLQEQIGRQMSVQRFGATVLGALGAIATILTILGAYVLAESMAVLRMREMGIRAALGATSPQLAMLVLSQSATLVGIGILFGVALAWLGSRMIRAFLFRVQPLDPTTLAIVAVGIVALAMLVSLRPALRAYRLDLAAVLKQE